MTSAKIKEGRRQMVIVYSNYYIQILVMEPTFVF